MSQERGGRSDLNAISLIQFFSEVSLREKSLKSAAAISAQLLLALPYPSNFPDPYNGIPLKKNPTQIPTNNLILAEFFRQAEIFVNPPLSTAG